MKLNIDHDPDALRMDSKRHTPVMPQEIRRFCAPAPGGSFLDATVGLGGHAALIAPLLGSRGHYIGIDRDKESLEIARAALRSLPVKCTLIHDDYRNVDRILTTLNIRQLDGVLFDLGISSFQLNDAARGFSFKADGPLDMRINQDSFLSAYDLINSLSEQELSLILRNYGQERWHNRIAHYLVEQRSRAPIQTTQELREAVLRAMPRGRKWQKIDPATRTFQAFRIAVNRELESLEIAMTKIPRFLKPQGRLCVISFHSLEDRIVKLKLRQFAHRQVVKLVVKKPLRPTEEEISLNPRARSARLRVAEKM